MAYIDDGFATLVSFSLSPTVKFREKTVTPPGITVGGSVDTTTMRNTAWRTKAPKKLKELSDMSLTASYDPAVYDDIVAMVGVNQSITVTFPDGQSLTFYGWLDSFTPSEISEGEQATADITVVCGNQDTDGAEIAPVTA
jgi:hypothetical protein